MTARLAILGVFALSLIVAGLMSLWTGGAGIFNPGPPPEGDVEYTSQWVRDQQWAQMLFSAAGPLIGAGLIAGVGALALVVRARQVAGTRTTSAPASTSARNPTTTPNSSPSSSNSSARSNVTSNLDALR